MNITTLLAAAVMAAPLPAGKGGPRIIPLPIVSEPAGATATAWFRDTHGDAQTASCTTPCTIGIPRAAPFVLVIEKGGYPLAKPPMRWCYQGLSGPNLCPGTVRAYLPQP